MSIAGDGPRIIINVEGDVDAAHGPELLDLTLRSGVVEEHSQVTLEMSMVSFVDSSGVAALIEAHRRLDREGVTLVIHNPSAAVLRVVRLAGLEAFFRIEHDVHPAGPAQAAS